jgi:hypothetical protein
MPLVVVGSNSVRRCRIRQRIQRGVCDEELRHGVDDRDAHIADEGQVVVQRIEQLIAVRRSGRVAECHARDHRISGAVATLGQQCREVPCSHRCRKHAGGSDTADVVPRAQVIDEKEELVAQDRSAEGPAKLVLRKRVRGDDGCLVLVLPGVRVQTIILQVSIGRSVVAVGTAPEHAHYSCAVHVSQFGR